MGDDLVSFHFDTSGFDAMTVEIKDPTSRATMYALRATGRYVARAAKARAPVYKGSDPRATAESGALRKSISNAKRLVHAGDAYQLKVGPFGRTRTGTTVVRYGSGKGNGAIEAVGKFRSSHTRLGVSIKGGTSSKGQVRGVPLYRSKVEAKYGFMEAGVAAAEAGMKDTFEAAYAKAWARWGA